MTKRSLLFNKGIVVGLLIVLLSFSSVEGLLFLQDQTDISESYTAKQTTVITLLNDQPRSQNIIIQIAPASQYLLNYVEIEDTTITLIPGEKKNILFNTEFPEGILSPETHQINIIARSDDDKSIAKTKILFTVSGIAKPSLKLNSEQFNLNNEEKTISVELENNGNVIMRPQPEIIITKGKEIINSIEYKTPLQIMPGRTYPITMRVDTSSLDEGTYETQIIFSDRDGIKIETQKTSFEVKNEYITENNGTNFILSITIGGIFSILIISLFFVNKELKKKKNPLVQKLKVLEKKERVMEQELQKLINETNQTINKSNKWIRKNMGQEYEFR